MEMNRTFADLIRFLDVTTRMSRDARRPSYYYYTTLSALACMLVNRKFRLTNIMSSRLNDQYEPREFGDTAKWNRMCIACFAENTPDNNPMWGLYGVPADEAICLMIPQRVLLKFFETAQKGFYFEKCAPGLFDWRWRGNDELLGELYGYAKLSRSKGRVAFHDVAYFPNMRMVPNERGKNDIVLEMSRRAEKIAEFDFSHGGFAGIAKLAGYVKRDVWMYENETRLQMEVPRDFAKMSAYIDLPDDFFNEISVTLGPNLDLNKKSLKWIRNASVNEVLTSYMDCRRSPCKQESALALSKYYGLLNYPGSGGNVNGMSAVPPAFFYGNKNVLKVKWSAKPLWRQYLERNEMK